MISFKQFLIEGGHATSKHDVERASADDIVKALEFTSKALKIPLSTLKQNVIGSARLTLMGKRADSGDVDIALSLTDHDPSTINTKMLKATGGRGSYNPGSKIGSYAVPVNGKQVQVDLMFVSDKDWAKWVYHSAHGDKSKYPGAVRNILLFTALAHTQEPGKDFVLRDEEGKAIVRASKSVRMDSGMERLLKMARLKNGKYAKGLSKVDPKEIEAHLREIGKKIPFSYDKDFTNDPDEVASFVFGKKVKASDLMSAEAVIKQIHKMKNAATVIKACKSELNRLKLPIPEEL